MSASAGALLLPVRRPRRSVLGCSVVKADITATEVVAILRAILEVAGARNAREQWREAYERAGLEWTAIEDRWVKA